MSKQFWIGLAVIVAILVGIVVVTNHAKDTGSATNTPPTEHTLGMGTKHVVLVEYGDYECSVCASFYPAVKQTVTQYGDNITFQFRELPLTQIHQNAFAGARAAEAAGLQGKYFEMHDLLYENQKSWAQANNAPAFFDVYAQQLNLNMTKFKQDFASQRVNDVINADTATFQKTGDDLATPTFYLDGKKLNNNNLIDAGGQPSTAAFAKVIDAEIMVKNPTKQ